MFIFVAVSLIIKFPAHMGIKRVRSHLSLIFNVNSKGFIRGKRFRDLSGSKWEAYFPT
jgi:hypothetical protein